MCSNQQRLVPFYRGIFYLQLVSSAVQSFVQKIFSTAEEAIANPSNGIHSTSTHSSKELFILAVYETCSLCVLFLKPNFEKIFCQFRQRHHVDRIQNLIKNFDQLQILRVWRQTALFKYRAIVTSSIVLHKSDTNIEHAQVMSIGQSVESLVLRFPRQSSNLSCFYVIHNIHKK